MIFSSKNSICITVIPVYPRNQKRKAIYLFDNPIKKRNNTYATARDKITFR